MWRKSSRSNNQEESNCVEVALTGSAALVRDSKNPEIVISAPRWDAFVEAVKRS